MDTSLRESRHNSLTLLVASVSVGEAHEQPEGIGSTSKATSSGRGASG